MKKKMIFTAACIMAASILAFTACKAENADEQDDTEQQTAAVEVKDATTIEDGVLLVGIYPDGSDFITLDDDGLVEGFEIELAKAIGELTMLDVRFVTMDYKDSFAELDVSRYDCIISAVAKSDAVDKVYDFSVSYYADDEGNEYAAVVKTGNNRLLNVLNRAISILKENGTLGELEAQWLDAGSGQALGTDTTAGMEN